MSLALSLKNVHISLHQTLVPFFKKNSEPSSNLPPSNLNLVGHCRLQHLMKIIFMNRRNLNGSPTEHRNTENQALGARQKNKLTE
jgi:hypothetical protein